MSTVYYTQHLDWIACTFDSQPVYPAAWSQTWVTARAFHGYALARKSGDGVLEMSNPERPDMGYHVQISGSALQALREYSTDSQIASWALSARKISRIDVAVNGHGVGMDASELLRLYHDGSCRTKIRKAPKIYVHGDNEGQGIYFGNRGATHAVVYDKAQELGLKDELWTRVEFRANEDRSQQIAKIVSDGGDVRPIVNAWVSYPGLQWWVDMMGKALSPLAPVEQKDTDTVLWLLRSAAPSLGREMALNPDIIHRFLEVAYAVMNEELSNGNLANRDDYPSGP